MCLVKADTAVIFVMLIVTASMSVAVFVAEVVIDQYATGKHGEQAESHLLKMEIRFYSSLNWIDVHLNAAGWIDINRKGENDGEGNTAKSIEEVVVQE